MSSDSSKAWLLWAPVVAYMGLIYIVSDTSFHFSLFQKAQKIHGDWLAHVVEYSVLGLLLSRALAFDARRKARFIFWVTVLIGVAYGATDEYHQQFVPTRDSSVYDLAADTVGLSLGSIVWLRRRERKNA